MTDNETVTYGAEQLKRNSVRYTLWSLVIACFLLLMAFAYPKLKSLFSEEHESDQLKVKAERVINYSELSAPPPIDLEQPEPQLLKVPPKIKTVKFLKPVAKKDEEVPDEIEMPSMEEMENTMIGISDNEGIDSIVFDIDQNAAMDLGPPPKEEPLLYVEMMPEFEGGESALLKYLAKNLKYPAVAKEAGIQGVVYIQFVVEKDGSVTEVEVLRGVHELLDKEAFRVIEEMPLWAPGKQNGRVVRVQFSIPIRFTIL